MDGLGGFFTAFMAAKDAGKGKKQGAWRDSRVQDEGDPEGQEAGGQPQQGGGSGGGGGGYTYESTIFGGSTYTTGSGLTYHGQEAIDRFDADHGGPPTDDITGEGAYYGEWKPSRGGALQKPPSGGRWGA